MSKASLLELCHGEKKYETFSINEYNESLLLKCRTEKKSQKILFQYQTEAMPKGISIEQFCSRNKVPYNISYKWYKDTRNKIVEVKVDGLPTLAQEEPKQENSSQEPSFIVTKPSGVRIPLKL